MRAVPSDKTLLTVIVALIAKEGQDPALSQPFRMPGTVEGLGFSCAVNTVINRRILCGE